ncbi:alkene reductase [Allorhodopirellula heiligendammensis]|uniref:N-ethylmaleimide reductase n=1 Tax=Allorhodopirellula heiligendammensis TaxID=2714739 RepID=A0A5C6BES4_9BACT|nr:alkene reductase [Allorhodopirellula heiligendammensis]TWU09796.1 N-ethylmaleimide reductase [Allorhodopirellula heiligendammensis]
MDPHENNILFQPLRIGMLELPNRILMAPLTRARASDRVPNEMMADYYAQRASAGLIISEATAISSQGFGWQGAAGIYTSEQVNGWKRVTDRVHANGGRIFLQLWHMGRKSHSDFHQGELSVAPSPVAPIGEAHAPAGKKQYEVPRELTIADIWGVIDDYATATRRAHAAGFDGVEIHAANGYLIDQFLRSSSNHREDEYGGSIKNRTRFMREVVEAVCGAWASDRTGIRLSPTMNEGGMSDSDPIALFSYAGQILNEYDLAYVHTAEAIKPGRIFNADEPRVTPYIRKAYHGKLLTNGGFDKQSAAAAIRNGEANAIAFGQLFIANPDLPERFRIGSRLNAPDSNTYYSAGPEGYVDYPMMPYASSSP